MPQDEFEYKHQNTTVLGVEWDNTLPSAEVRSVHRRNLQTVLDGLGLLNALDEGQLSCEGCGIKLTWENVGTIFRKEGKIHLSCDRPECIVLALNRDRSVTS